LTEITELDRAEAKLRDPEFRESLLDGKASLSGKHLDEVLAALDDARRWRALLSAGRLRPLGWAGLDREGKLNPDATYVHFGMEFWTHHAHDGDNAICKQVLTSFVEMIMAGENPAAATKAAQDEEAARLRDAAIILGKECRAIVRLLPQVGLNEAIALSGRPEMGRDRVITYLSTKGLLQQNDEGDDYGLTEKGFDLRDYLLNEFDEAWAEGT
jgi:hypothetical protein